MSTQVNMPGYLAGIWMIDAAGSDVSFEARLLGVAKVRGRFDGFEGTIVTAENPLDSLADAVIKTASVRTRNSTRDKHLRRSDFLNVEQYPTMTFASTGVRVEGGNFLLDGDLTIRAITKQVTLNLKLNGFGVGPDGKPTAGFSAFTEISRSEFGVTGGSARTVIGDRIKIIIEIKAHRQD
jgi:polyisoprenoid-binding protein YceI